MPRALRVAGVGDAPPYAGQVRNYVGLAIRMNDKMNRVKAFCKRGTLRGFHWPGAQSHTSSGKG